MAYATARRETMVAAGESHTPMLAYSVNNIAVKLSSLYAVRCLHSGHRPRMAMIIYNFNYTLALYHVFTANLN